MQALQIHRALTETASSEADIRPHSVGSCKVHPLGIMKLGERMVVQDWQIAAVLGLSILAEGLCVMSHARENRLVSRV
jgi:hypothetical protein